MYGDKSSPQAGYSAVMVTLQEKQSYVTAPNSPADLYRGVFQVCQREGEKECVMSRGGVCDVT